MRNQASPGVTIGSVLLLSACFSAAEVQQETTAYASVPGGQIEYVESGPANGETVVFIHGGGLAESFLPIMRDPVLERFHRVRVHRLQYMGSADPRDLENVDDVTAVIAVLDTLNVQRAHFVGHSSGTTVALDIAEDYPDRVASLVIIDVGSFAGQSEEQVEQRIRQIQERSRQSSASTSCDGESALENRYGSDIFGDDWRDYFTAVPGGWEQAVKDICRRREPSGASRPLDPEQLRARFSAEPRQPPANHPALMMWGSESPFAESMYRAVQDGPASLRGQEIADTDHALVVQKPAEIALMISGWLGANPIQ